MVLELLKDYILLFTGAMIGLLLSGLCRVAALSDQRIDAMGHAENAMEQLKE